jgi:hypothetical protein
MTATVQLGVLSSRVVPPGETVPVSPLGSHRIEVDVSTAANRAWVAGEIAAGRVCWDCPVPSWYHQMASTDTIQLRWGSRYPWLDLGPRRVRPGEMFEHEVGTPAGQALVFRWVRLDQATVVGPTPKWLADRLAAVAPAGGPPLTAVPAAAAPRPGNPDRAGQIQAAWARLAR